MKPIFITLILTGVAIALLLQRAIGSENESPSDRNSSLEL